jgi:hypothetical protein
MDDLDNKNVSLIREDILSKNVMHKLYNQLSFIESNIKHIQNLYYKKDIKNVRYI